MNTGNKYEFADNPISMVAFFAGPAMLAPTLLGTVFRKWYECYGFTGIRPVLGTNYRKPGDEQDAERLRAGRGATPSATSGDSSPCQVEPSRCLWFEWECGVPLPRGVRHNARPYRKRGALRREPDSY